MLRAPTKKEVRIPAVRPNAGGEAAYRKRLDTELAAMQKDVIRTVSTVYDDNPPEMAQDKSPAAALRAAMKDLGRKWTRRFDRLAETWGRKFTEQATSHADRAFSASLRKAGFTVKFKMTAAANDVFQATLSEQVNLIRSIPESCLTQVETLVNQSVQAGRDVGGLAKAIQEQFGVTRRRAATIARDQSNKATATITRVRQTELGITQARWLHSSGGRTPRPEHVAFSQGRNGGPLYDVRKGAFLEGKFTFPGHEINCLPSDSVIELTAGIKRLWRRRYHGELTVLTTQSGKTIKATPNHPVLTQRGWVPFQFVDVGDDIVGIDKQVFDGVEAHVDCDYPTIAQMFDAASTYFLRADSVGALAQFHGDGTDEKVETVDIDGFLPDELDALSCKEFAELFLSGAYHRLVSLGFQPESTLLSACNGLFCATESVVRGFSALLPLLHGHLLHTDDVGAGLISEIDACLDEASANSPAIRSVLLGQGQDAHSGSIFRNQRIVGQLFGLMARASLSWKSNTASADELGNGRLVQPDNLGGISDCHSTRDILDRVVNTGRIDFNGHVFNLETHQGWYTTTGTIVQNCRCVSISVIPGLDD